MPYTASALIVQAMPYVRRVCAYRGDRYIHLPCVHCCHARLTASKLASIANIRLLQAISIAACGLHCASEHPMVQCILLIKIIAAISCSHSASALASWTTTSCPCNAVTTLVMTGAVGLTPGSDASSPAKKLLSCSRRAVAGGG